jgi:hypothetical protein
LARISAIDLYLAEHLEIHVIFSLCKFQYFGIAARLLATKLVAGKRQNLKRMLGEFFLQSTQPGVL